jgi:hypothetical protein
VLNQNNLKEKNMTLALRLSIEEKIALWKEHPRFNEDGSKSKGWNPIQNDGRDIAALQKQFHPLVWRDNRLFRINDIEVSIVDSFTYAPKIEDEIISPNLVGRCITFHTNAVPSCFNPSIQEVLLQLPLQILQEKDNLYFATEAISDRAPECIVGHDGGFHIAVTSIYRA